MYRTTAVLAWGITWAIACASGPEERPEPQPATAPEPSPVPVGEFPPPPDPLKGKSLAQICDDDTLALIKFSFSDLQSDFAGVCCGDGGLKDDMRCELDWPFSDVPPCTAYDDLRNGIFMHYGYPFNSPEWRQRSEKNPDYKRRKDFMPDWMTDEAKANVETLKKLKKDKVACE